MADKKITELTESLLPQYNAIIPFVADPSGTPLNRYTTINNLFGAVKNAKQYGVVGDGVTDDTAALQALFALGGNIYLPPGTYLVTSYLGFGGNVWIHGAGMGVTIIKVKDGTILPVCGVVEVAGYYPGGTVERLENVTISDLSIDGNYTNCPGTGEYECLLMTYRNNAHVVRVETYGASESGIAGSADQLEDDSIFYPVEYIGCVSHDNDAEGFQISSSIMTDCWAYFNGASGFASYSPWTGFYTNEVMSWTNCHAFGNGVSGFTFSSQSGLSFSGGGNFTGCSSIRNESYGFNIGTRSGTVIQGCYIAYNDYDGIFLSQNHHVISNNIIKNNGQNPVLGSYNKNAGVTMFLSPSYVKIENNHIFDDQGTATQTYAIGGVSYSSPTGVIIRNNTFHGHLTGVIETGVSSVSDTQIRNNYGYNPVGLSAISPGASPYTYTAGASPEEIYITGGTVSDIKRASTTIATASPCRVSLEPYQTLVVTYSVIPTMVKDVK